MTAPRALQAVADLRRAMGAGDYAAAAEIARQPDALEGLATLTVYAAEMAGEAGRARREAVEARLAEAERARVHAGIAPLLDELIAVLAGVMPVPEGPVCGTCKRSLRRCRDCPYCGTRNARSSAWPAAARELIAHPRPSRWPGTTTTSQKECS